MSYLKTTFVSHSRKVCSLYKRAIRNIEADCNDRHSFRYRAVYMRKRFDDNKNEVDMRKSKEMLELGEEELFLNQHHSPLYFPKSAGGVAYQREVMREDWTVDFWEGPEKAQYPDYFAKRELRKKEYVAMWEKQHGKATPPDEAH